MNFIFHEDFLLVSAIRCVDKITNEILQLEKETDGLLKQVLN